MNECWFIIDKNINLNNYYEIVRDFAENLIEEVKVDKVEPMSAIIQKHTL